MAWKDVELLVLMQVTDELWKLREQPEAQIRVLKYLVDRLGLPIRLQINQKFVAPVVERCEQSRLEEIEPVPYIG